MENLSNKRKIAQVVDLADDLIEDPDASNPIPKKQKSGEEVLFPDVHADSLVRISENVLKLKDGCEMIGDGLCALLGSEDILNWEDFNEKCDACLLNIANIGFFLEKVEKRIRKVQRSVANLEQDKK